MAGASITMASAPRHCSEDINEYGHPSMCICETGVYNPQTGQCGKKEESCKGGTEKPANGLDCRGKTSTGVVLVTLRKCSNSPYYLTTLLERPSGKKIVTKSTWDYYDGAVWSSDDFNFHLMFEEGSGLSRGLLSDSRIMSGNGIDVSCIHF